MKNYHVGSTSWLIALGKISVMCWIFISASYANLPTWPDESYSYYANNTSLKQVFHDFSSGFGTSLKVAENVEGHLSGRLTAKSPIAFMNRLASMYGLSWFVTSGVLYISRAEDTVTRSIRIPAGTIHQIRGALSELGILDRRFGWGELPEQNIILISGPDSYVRIVENTVKNLPIVAGGVQVSVFRLQNAFVEDRAVDFRGKSVVTPGLATILKGLLLDKPVPHLSVARQEELRKLAKPLVRPISNSDENISTNERIERKSFLEEAAHVLQGASNRSSSSISGSSSGIEDDRKTSSYPVVPGYAGPLIESDPRLNAIIISDLPEKMPIYEQLIKEMDIATALIEIEAYIIDVNTTKLQDLGISWSGRILNGKVAVNYGNPQLDYGHRSLAIGVAEKGTVNATTLITDSLDFFLSRLRLLEDSGDARIQSSPSILTIENTSSILDFSETLYIRTTGERVANITPVTAGTSLRVLPRVLYNDKDQSYSVMMAIDVEDGQIQEKRQFDGLPTLRKSSISTSAVVQENESLLIGGYTTDQQSTTIQKIPILGDIPLFGRLFRQSSSTVQKRERLFMIKPRVISLPRPVADKMKGDQETRDREQTVTKAEEMNFISSSGEIVLPEFFPMGDTPGSLAETQVKQPSVIVPVLNTKPMIMAPKNTPVIHQYDEVELELWDENITQSSPAYMPQYYSNLSAGGGTQKDVEVWAVTNEVGSDGATIIIPEKMKKSPRPTNPGEYYTGAPLVVTPTDRYYALPLPSTKLPHTPLVTSDHHPVQ